MRARILAVGLAASALLMPLASSAQENTDDAPWDFIEFEVKSWGSPLSSWRIIPDGGGSWAEAVRPDGTAPNEPASTAWHEIAPDEANYAKLVAILDDLPAPAPNSEYCTNFMSDAPYGTLRLTKGATTTEIAWNSGCMDDNYIAFVEILKAADQHMQSLGKAAPVSRIDPPTKR